MAKADPTKAVAGAADTATADATSAAGATVAAVVVADTTAAPAAEGATSENTPVPGGGRWKWDIAGPGWVVATE